MKKCILLLLIISFSFNINAQNEACDGARFYEDNFDIVKLTAGLKYGEGETISGNLQELFLDVYEPEGDQATVRPVVFLAFGGSFIGGEREDVAFLCEAYALKGFVAVAIDYRLYDGPLLPLPTADQMKNVVIKSVSDMKAAIRYMREDAATDNLYRIDPEMVFVGGISAGSITAFHTAVLDDSDDLPQDIRDIIADNGGIEGNSSDNFEYSSEVQGLVNFSGGLSSASWIDANDPPFLSIHDDMDGIVPYETGFASIFEIPIIYMEGSKTCQEAGDSAGVINKLRTIDNSDGHVSYFFESPSTTADNIEYSSNFLADIVCLGQPTNTEDIAKELEMISVFPNPSNGILNISNGENFDLNIQLYDVLGRQLDSYTDTSTFDIRNHPNGLYLLRIIDKKSESSKTVKVILEK